MRRSVAFLGILALSWFQIIALHCDMGTEHHPAGTEHAATAMQHAAGTPADRHAPDHAPPARHGPDQGCLMIMACGYSIVRHPRSVVMDRLPGTVVRAVLLANPIPVAADLAAETPPPRLTA